MVKRIAIFGASGIGKFHAREFSSAGCEVVAILGSSRESSIETAKMLEKEFGIKARPYYDIQELLENEELDAVSVCTPAELHYDQVLACLNKGLNVLCEKPLTGDIKQAQELFQIAHKKKLTLVENTQWPAVLEYIKYDSGVSSFEMRMQPGVKGEAMLKDHLPHTNSMLIKLAGVGHAENVNFVKVTDEEIEIVFEYIVKDKCIGVKYFLDFKTERPRDVSFKINDLEFRRVVGKNYSQTLMVDGSTVKIEDPLKKSIQKFVDAVNGDGPPLVSENEILANLELQEELLKSYHLI